VSITTDGVIAWLSAYAAGIAAHKDELTRLDADIGDADHGANMDRGFAAVAAKLPGLAGQDLAGVLKTVAMTLISTIGGASGPLYGTLFLQMSVAATGKVELNAAGWEAALRAGVEGVARRGKAVRGEKTMLDALLPAVEALSAALARGAPLGEALWRCERAAHQGMLDTIPLVATKGRASYLGERSAGHQDPGATSAHLLVRTAAEAWAPGQA
jgi:phosphoenolpyruvate---glycerone phosphotransferase subunit DhaL